MSNTQNTKYKVEVKNLPKSEVEIKGQIEAPLLDGARKKAIKRFSEKLDLPGFRKGNVPDKVVIERVGESELLEEAADILMNEFYPQILTENNLDTIGRPKVSITKLALGNPVEFTITTAVLPQFDLPDYKKIAEKTREAASASKEEATASKREIEDVVLQIRKNKAHYDWHQKNPKADHHNHLIQSEDSSEPLRPDFEKEENLPVFDDELAKSAGKFENAEELKKKIKENIISEKKLRNLEKNRAQIMEALVKETKMDLPDVLIESETEKSLAQMKDEVERLGGKFEDYLKETKKTEEDMKKDLRENSEKKAKIQLIFNKIAQAEGIDPNKEIMEHEVKQILEHYPSANPDNARIYVATQLINQEVLKLLEKSSSKGE